ncbi:hypothetical protein [Saccharopolyspora phatthalungensis]|uniref:Asp23/Gls24 family envelope stress response protein n=1 Tax=Saccharopolyspora phatthalungensis TaxID=664693 RepID=A0A840QD27_9PSEU|nr:hypothetical protein [Saccharopolyspora phatthalungensis]MBB5156355.1 hypothetical protein [Saccharopolyspora phatthalungensis]
MPEPISASELADRVLAHPSVVRLHGGQFGEIATYRPGSKVVGVRLPDIGAVAEPGAGAVEIGVVLRLGRPLPEIVAELRGTLAEVLGKSRVDITVADVITTNEPQESA